MDSIGRSASFSARPPFLASSLQFVVLSFEGPDLYSMVGGLGVRVTEMTRTLAEMGFVTRLFFVGDPNSEPITEVIEGRLWLYRWSSEVAKRYPKNVYEGELAKIEDYQKSLPHFILNEIVIPNAAAGVTTIVLAEDWHTARAISSLAELVCAQGLLSRCLFLWNANNTFGFQAIDWKLLTSYVQLVTVSRYMREKMRSLGLTPLVVQNGIPPRYWETVDEEAGSTLRDIFPGQLLLAKIGRYHPDKRWIMAIESIGECKRLGLQPRLFVRGGTEEYGEQVRLKAKAEGLSWGRVKPESTDTEAIIAAIKHSCGYDVIELDFFVPEAFLRVLYWASQAVLANSGHEPFGLVGIEVMACGGIAITGSTGEEYLQSFYNGIAIGSDDYREITVYLRELVNDPDLGAAIRLAARKTSRLYDWQIMIKDLLRKIEFVAWTRGVNLGK